MVALFIDEALFASFHSGEEKAFSAIFEMYYPRLVIYAFQLTDAEPEAKEIASDVLSRAFGRYIIYMSAAHLNNYLYASVRNAAIDYLRYRHIRDQKFDDYLAVQLNDNELVNIELDSALLEKLYQAIELLPEKSRQVIHGLYVEQLSYKELAEKLGTTVKNIENLRAYALKKLKNELGPSVSLSLLVVLLSRYLHVFA